MKSKWSLFVGLAILTLGIALKYVTNLNLTPVLLIVIGVLFKIYYIIQKAKTGEYKPGIELLFLLLGLILFGTGTYIKSHEPSFNPKFLTIPGILFKTTFIALVISNIKKNRKTA